MGGEKPRDFPVGLLAYLQNLFIREVGNREISQAGLEISKVFGGYGHIQGNPVFIKAVDTFGHAPGPEHIFVI